MYVASWITKNRTNVDNNNTVNNFELKQPLKINFCLIYAFSGKIKCYLTHVIDCYTNNLNKARKYSIYFFIKLVKQENIL